MKKEINFKEKEKIPLRNVHHFVVVDPHITPLSGSNLQAFSPVGRHDHRVSPLQMFLVFEVQVKSTKKKIKTHPLSWLHPIILYN